MASLAVVVSQCSSRHLLISYWDAPRATSPNLCVCFHGSKREIYRARLHCRVTSIFQEAVLCHQIIEDIDSIGALPNADDADGERAQHESAKKKVSNIANILILAPKIYTWYGTELGSGGCITSRLERMVHTSMDIHYNDQS